MKKTFNINISGIIFHIDEDAYQKLNAYLERLKSHFRGTKGSEEIINDIESRIAEILQEKLSDTKQVMSLQDVNEVIGIMGEPSEFSEEEDESSESRSESYAYYPPRKRLYRDPENKVIGGVSSGLAHYMNIDPIWVRLIFLITLFAGGTGILIYIILWIIMPEARSTAERLEMRGEPVTIDNIERSIREEFENLKSKINDLSNRAKGTYKKKSADGRTFFENLIGLFVNLVRILFRVLVIIIGVALFIAGVSLLIAFIAAVFNWGAPFYMNGEEWVVFSIPFLSDLLLGPGSSSGLLNVSIYLFFGIPIIMLIYLATRMIFRIEGTRFVGLIALGFWLVGLIILSYYTMSLIRDFSDETRVIEKSSLSVPAGDTLQLYVHKNKPAEYYGRFHSGGFPSEDVIFSRDGGLLGKVNLEIKKSGEDEMALVQRKYARGKNMEDAAERADRIEYDFESYQNELTLNRYFSLTEEESWRAQDLKLILQLPEGTILYISGEAKDIIDWWRFSYSDEVENNYFIMTDDGLKKIEGMEGKTEPVKTKAIETEEPKEENLSSLEKSSPANPLAIVFNTTLRYIGNVI